MKVLTKVMTFINYNYQSLLTMFQGILYWVV
jgi:hypothetical protein